MALVGPEIIGLARVSVTESRLGTEAAYVFSNGFEAVKVEGALPGAVVIPSPTPGTYVLFLDEPVDAGSMATQGGVKARCDVVGVSVPALPNPAIPPVKLNWYYACYTLTGVYAAVNPKKAIVVVATDSTGAPWVDDLLFDIVVARDPMTEFVAKKFVG